MTLRLRGSITLHLHVVPGIAAEELAPLVPGVEGHDHQGNQSCNSEPEDWRLHQLRVDALIVVARLARVTPPRHKPHPHEREDEANEPDPVEVSGHYNENDVVDDDHCKDGDHTEHEEAHCLSILIIDALCLNLVVDQAPEEAG